MLGLMVWALHILLTRLIGVPPGGAWALVVAMVALVGLYTAWGGLRSVVFTDVVQGLMVFLGAAVILHAAWSGAGGWDGARESLAAIDPAGTPVSRPLAGLPRMSSYRGDDGATPPAVVFIGWLIVAGGYWTVNHTQTMRLMGTRSLWDMRMAALLGTAVSAPVMVACAVLGVFGRALFPGLEPADEMYPALIERYLGPGLKGLVVAGVLAAAMSTFDSMGSALSAVFTRDVWRRLVVRGRDEAYYLRVSRWSTVAILALGFLYIPFIAAKKTMLEAFLTLIPVFVTPLFVLYLAGTLTRAHPRSGIAGLVAGAAYGVVALCDRELDLARLRWLPSWFTGRWEAFLWSAAITAATMALVTAALGRDGRPPAAGIPVREHPFARRVPAWLEPRWLAAVLLVATTSVVLVFFW
jgi:SSS family solute:Na+ symporter